MPVDTSSYGLLGQPEQSSPSEAFQRAFASTQQMRGQEENRRGLDEQRRSLEEQRAAATAKLRQEAADRALADEAIRLGGGVRGATLAAAAKMAPHAVVGLTEFFDKSDRSRAEIDKLEEELHAKRLDHLGLTAEQVLTHGADALPTALAWHAEQFPKEAEQISQLTQRLQGMAPEQVKAFLEQQRDASPAYQARKGKNTPQVVGPGGSLIDDTGKVLFSAPTKPPAVNAGSFEDYVLRAAKEKGVDPSALTTKDIEAARKKYQQADDRPTASITIANQGTQNVKDAVAGMKDGTIPPLLPGRASKEYVELLAEAHRQGYDLAGAATDWTATQKHIATLNGAQQLRLNQAVNQLPDLLDTVDVLASKWKGGRFPLLNNVTLKSAKAGLYGHEAASLANQLDAQIADVTADLGNVYMGGTSPTDHALTLAAKSLSATWDEKVLHDMVALARKNVTIRQNSIKSTGVAGASASNPYGQPPPQNAAPAAPAGRVEQWVKDPQTGKMVKKGGL